MIERVRVRSAPRVDEYDVVIEPAGIDRLGAVVPRRHSYAIIADATVSSLYAKRAAEALGDARVLSLSFPPGEANKTAATWQTLQEQLTREGFGRDGCVIALGGGVTGDLAGFVAATYMRGVDLVQVPTTLLAMIDASIGGKTGIDMAAGKNLVGAFHQPQVVLIDPLLLRTLPHAELRYGLAEAVKHGAIVDADYLGWIEHSIAAIFEQKMHVVTELVRRSVEIKAAFVAEDVLERGARAALNFGHTIGHALEQVTAYAMPHGHAVSVGMMAECLAGEEAGITENGSAARLGAVLSALGLPTALPSGCDPASVLTAAGSDKKRRAGEKHYALLSQIGQIARGEKGEWTRALPDDVVRKALARLSIT